jgi:cellulose synthase operon protein C
MKVQMLTKESVASRLEGLGSSKAVLSVDEKPQLWQYREAAAVLTSFDPINLNPTTKNTKDRRNILSSMIGDTYLSYNAVGEPIWSLRNDVRLAALKRLGSRSRIQQALRANPLRPQDTLQKVFESYIAGKPKPLAEMSRDELSSALQSCQWLRDIVPNLPDEAAIRRQLDLVTLLGPFRSLAGPHFRGRRIELERLHNFVFGPRNEMFHYLAVCGVGGAGKSTLLAKFILDYASLTNDKEQLAFVYLDFDRSTLSANQPATILVEALRQLEIQFPAHAPELLRIRKEWNSPDLYSPSETSGMGSFVEADQEVQSVYVPYLAKEFASLIKRIGIPKVLFVLDTFEEVQYLGSEYVENVYALLSQLRRIGLPIATIFATRTPLVRPNTEILSINELDLDAALGYVAAHGISDPVLAKEIVARIGGNPLSLSLAATVVRAEGEQAAKAFSTFDVQQELVQGQLYRRILQHIHNSDVRKLAHPGLVVRKITPDVILSVLSGPCEVRIKDRAAAEALFRELKREDTLVQLSDDGAVTHREDVRQVMLSLLIRDMPTTVRKIHLAAVSFYRKRSDASSRAEEIYHRLCLDQEPTTIEKRWMDGIESQLRSSMFELPLRAKRFLAAKLDLALDEELTQTLTLVDWENNSEKRALQLLRFNRAEEVLRILHERKERSLGSRIPLLEAQALQYLKRTSQARTVAAQGLKNAESYGDGNLILDLLSFLGALEANSRRWGPCKTFLDRALKVANSLDNKTRQLEVGVTRLILLRSTKAFSLSDRHESKDALASVFRKISAKELSRDTSLAFDVAGELGDAHPDVVKSVILACGLPPVSTNRLLYCLSKWDRELNNEESRWPLARAAGLPVQETSKSPWLSLEGTSMTRLTNIVQSLLKRFPLTESVAAVFAKFMRDRTTAVPLPARRSSTNPAKVAPAPTVFPTTRRKRATRRLGSTRVSVRKK